MYLPGSASARRCDASLVRSRADCKWRPAGQRIPPDLWLCGSGANDTRTRDPLLAKVVWISAIPAAILIATHVDWPPLTEVDRWSLLDRARSGHVTSRGDLPISWPHTVTPSRTQPHKRADYGRPITVLCAGQGHCGQGRSEWAGGDRTHDRRIMRTTHPFPGSSNCPNVPAIASAVPLPTCFAHFALARSLAGRIAIGQRGHAQSQPDHAPSPSKMITLRNICSVVVSEHEVAVDLGEHPFLPAANSAWPIRSMCPPDVRPVVVHHQSLNSVWDPPVQLCTSVPQVAVPAAPKAAGRCARHAHTAQT